MKQVKPEKADFATIKIAQIQLFNLSEICSTEEEK